MIIVLSEPLKLENLRFPVITSILIQSIRSVQWGASAVSLPLRLLRVCREPKVSRRVEMFSASKVPRNENFEGRWANILGFQCGWTWVSWGSWLWVEGIAVIANCLEFPQLTDFQNSAKASRHWATPTGEVAHGLDAGEKAGEIAQPRWLRALVWFWPMFRNKDLRMVSNKKRETLQFLYLDHWTFTSLSFLFCKTVKAPGMDFVKTILMISAGEAQGSLWGRIWRGRRWFISRLAASKALETHDWREHFSALGE